MAAKELRSLDVVEASTVCSMMVSYHSKGWFLHFAVPWGWTRGAFPFSLRSLAQLHTTSSLTPCGRRCGDPTTTPNEIRRRSRLCQEPGGRPHRPSLQIGEPQPPRLGRLGGPPSHPGLHPTHPNRDRGCRLLRPDPQPRQCPQRRLQLAVGLRPEVGQAHLARRVPESRLAGRPQRHPKPQLVGSDLLRLEFPSS